MSVPLSLLALLSQGPAYGARIKAEFEARTGHAFPLNVGQVYTTLARLERDGLVVPDGGPDDEGRIPYRLTDVGAQQVSTWWESPVDRSEPARDELVMKLALAVATPRVDAQAVIQRQRAAAMSHLQGLTRAKLALTAPGQPPQPAAIPTPTTLSDQVVLEHRLYAVEAELRWLDHVEELLHRAGPATAASAAASTAVPTTASAAAPATASAAAVTGAVPASAGPAPAATPPSGPPSAAPASPNFARPAPSDTRH